MAADHDAPALRLADILRLVQTGGHPTQLYLAERFGIYRLSDVIEPGADRLNQLASQCRCSPIPADVRNFERICGAEQPFPTADRRSWLDLLKSGPTGVLGTPGQLGPS